MQLTSLFIEKELISIGVAGCDLRCPYCALRAKGQKELSVSAILETIDEAGCKEIAIGGGEPALQAAELKQMLPQLKGRKVYLKTNGSKQEAIREFIPLMDKFTLEIKAPFGDLNACSKLTGLTAGESACYFESLRETLSLLQDKTYGIWIRVIPDFINSSTLPDIISSCGKPSEVVLYQFLSNPGIDLPYYGYKSPVPSRPELEFLATIAKQHVQRVVVEARSQHRRCQCCE